MSATAAITNGSATAQAPARLVEAFDRNQATFVSMTQASNTTTSMGRLTPNILLSFARFEREVIGERIRDKFAAASDAKGPLVERVACRAAEEGRRCTSGPRRPARSCGILFIGGLEGRMPQDKDNFRFYVARKVSNPSTARFLFATGIECSYPTIETPQGRLRRDQMHECGHYERWAEDFDLVTKVGCRLLRYGPPYYNIHLGPGRYDWSFTDLVLPDLRKRGINPIIDLCHFGVPDWIGDFQNPDFPRLFSEYARAFAERYPWVRLYTPVNEMYITAEFSAYYGWWNEHLTSHSAFVTAVKNITRANMEAMLSILAVRPDALFILCESSEHTHANHPELVRKAQMFNERRFLTLDLTVGRRVNSGMYVYLMDNGMTNDEYTYFLRQDLREHFIVGHDYYITNEHLLVDAETRHASGEIFGYYVLAKQYHERYRLPIMHTETNMLEPGATNWLWKTWANVQQLRLDGIPLCGMTWYSLTDQVDWDTALREKNDRVNPLGLYDLERKIRPAGAAYKRLIAQWAETPLLPHGPLTLVGGVKSEGG